MGRRKQSKQQEQQMNTKTLSLSQVTKWLSWFWDLERIWSLECVLEWMLLLLYWIGTSEGGWVVFKARVSTYPSRWRRNKDGKEKTLMPLKEMVGVFIASNHFLAVGCFCWRWAHRIVRWRTGQPLFIVRCVPRQHACWGLERLDCWNPCPIVAPDSPVPHWTCPVRSDFSALISDVHCSLCSRPLVPGYRCSVGSPDMSGAHLTVRWIIAERALEKPESELFKCCSACCTGHCLVRHWQHTLKSFAPNLFESPT
jgi:hypothetical protein